MAEEGHPQESAREKLFVGNISYRVTARELRKFFSEFGEVRYCQIVKDHRKRWSRGIGFVTFEETSTAEAVLSLPSHQFVLDGREMRVARAETPKRVKLRQTASKPANSEDSNGEINSEFGNTDEEDLKHHVVESNREESVSETKCALIQPTAVHLSAGKREEQLSACVVCGDPSLPDLSDDLWLLIFSFLRINDKTRIERVCRRWRSLLLLSWKSIRSLSFENMFKSIFKGGSHQLTDGLLHTFLKRCGGGLVRLDLSSSPHHLTDYALDLVGLYCPTLQHLDLSNMAVTRISLKTMVERIEKLKSISLQRCSNIGENGLWWVLKSLRSLQSINVADSRRLTGQCFFQAPGTLKEVFMSDCHHLTDKGVNLLSDRCPNLETIDISKCPNLTGEALSALTKNCRKLKKLRFVSYSNKGVETAHFMTLSNLPLLEELVVNRHTSVTDQVLCEIGGYCPNLRYLSCEACHCVSDECTRYLAQCEQLEHVVLSYCDNFSDKGLLHLSKLHADLKKVVVRACQGITDEGVGQLCSLCPDLLELDVSGCLSVTDCVLPVLQEALCFLRRDTKTPLSIILGGTLVTPEKAIQFAEKSRVNVSLYDLSTSQLSSYFDPYLKLRECHTVSVYTEVASQNPPFCIIT
jgi:hypothetical protein